MSLFDLDNDNEPTSAQAAPPPHQSLDDTPHNYRLITSPVEAANLVSGMLDKPRVAISLLGTGDNAMTLKIMGIALCAQPHEAAFVKCDGKPDMLKALAPLFGGKACIVSSDIKRTMVALAQHGIGFTAPYYDTAVAHYLLQPERGHSIAEMAYELLHYTAISPESLLGPKRAATNSSPHSWLPKPSPAGPVRPPTSPCNCPTFSTRHCRSRDLTNC